jgi:hypothetical protein
MGGIGIDDTLYRRSMMLGAACFDVLIYIVAGRIGRSGSGRLLYRD